jgi:hypothetical protein
MKHNIASCGKTTDRLYFESKLESKMNQNMNIQIMINIDVDKLSL